MNDPADRKRAFRVTMGSLGFERDRSVTDGYCYNGKVRAAARDISISLTFGNLEFSRLPKARLLVPEKEAPHVVAHLEDSGKLCFANDRDIVLDRYDLPGTVSLCVELARRGVERALTRKQVQNEIAAEFPQHWRGSIFYYDLVQAKAWSKVYRIPRGKGGNIALISSVSSVPAVFTHDVKELERVEKEAQPVHVIRVTSDLTFENGERAPETLAEFIAWLERQKSGLADRALNALVHHYPYVSPIFVLSPNGCVGIKVDFPEALARKLQTKTGLKRVLTQRNVRITRLSGRCVDSSYIFGRNMNNQNPLFGRRIALIGCGAIGSYLAKLLVQCGAGSDGGCLLVLDQDTLDPGNIGRHLLGPTYIGEAKADALETELKRIFPGANVINIIGEAIESINTLMPYDLIIDATGEEAFSIALNHRILQARKSGIGPDAIYVSLFGNGAAAQSFLYNGVGYACFKCLKPDLSGQHRFDPMKQGATVRATAAACGEASYVPYSVAAPTIAAAQALQLALDWNSGKPPFRLLTIQIDAEVTKNVSPKNPDISPRCPCCGEDAAMAATDVNSA